MKKKIKYIIIAALIIAAVAVFFAVRKNNNKPEWRTEQPSTGTVREVVTATGAINPYVLVEVGTEVSGTINKIFKDFNDNVRKGDLLAKLDTEILATNLESAKADVSKAQITRDEALMDFNLSKELFEKGMGTEYDMQKNRFSYNQSELNLSNAKLKMQTAQKNLNNATITSPIDGVIVARNVNEGQTVAASFNSPTLFTIANNLDQMQITANVDEADIGKIKVDMPVEFTVDAYAGEQFTGSVQQIRLNSTVEQNVVSYSVIIDADNPGHKLLPGMTTNVTIIIQSKENALRIPETATRFSPSKEVWELFGLKWDEELIANARKSAMEKLMANQTAAMGTANAQTSDRKVSADSSQTARATRPMPGGRPPTGTENGRPSGFSRAGGGNSRMASIWILKGKTPELIMVRTGVSDGANVEVLSQLDPKTTIITGVNYKDPSQAKGSSAIQSGPGMGPRF